MYFSRAMLMSTLIAQPAWAERPQALNIIYPCGKNTLPQKPDHIPTKEQFEAAILDVHQDAVFGTVVNFANPVQAMEYKLEFGEGKAHFDCDDFSYAFKAFADFRYRTKVVNGDKYSKSVWQMAFAMVNKKSNKAVGHVVNVMQYWQTANLLDPTDPKGCIINTLIEPQRKGIIYAWPQKIGLACKIKDLLPLDPDYVPSRTIDLWRAYAKHAEENGAEGAIKFSEVPIWKEIVNPHSYYLWNDFKHVSEPNVKVFHVHTLINAFGALGTKVKLLGPNQLELQFEKYPLSRQKFSQEVLSLIPVQGENGQLRYATFDDLGLDSGN